MPPPRTPRRPENSGSRVGALEPPLGLLGLLGCKMSYAGCRQCPPARWKLRIAIALCDPRCGEEHVPKRCVRTKAAKAVKADAADAKGAKANGADDAETVESTDDEANNLMDELGQIEEGDVDEDEDDASALGHGHDDNPEDPEIQRVAKFLQDNRGNADIEAQITESIDRNCCDDDDEDALIDATLGIME
eukprot:6621570-Pyramimonas_sp.AAC.3